MTKRRAAINKIFKDWQCTWNEAWAAVHFETETLEETRKAIAQAVTYRRLFKSYLPAAIEFMKTEEPGIGDVWIESHAYDLADEAATAHVYEWETQELVDYASITENEILAVLDEMYGD